MKTFTRLLGTLGCVTLVALLATSCGKGVGSGAAVFESAGAEVKDAWNKGLAAAKAHDYATALTTFQRLRARPGLTPEQIKALEQTATAVSDQMYEAANKGDADAKKAIEYLRTARAR